MIMPVKITKKKLHYYHLCFSGRFPTWFLLRFHHPLSSEKQPWGTSGTGFYWLDASPVQPTVQKQW